MGAECGAAQASAARVTGLPTERAGGGNFTGGVKTAGGAGRKKRSRKALLRGHPGSGVFARWAQGGYFDILIMSESRA